MENETVQQRLKFTNNLLACMGQFEPPDLEQLRDEVDYLRRSLLSLKSDVSESHSLRDARQTLPPLLLQAITVMAERPVPNFSLQN